MQKIDLTNLDERFRLQKDPTRNQEKYSPTLRQEKLINALWERMNQLYRHKWDKAEGPRRNENKKYTANFLLWCRKTEHIDDEGFKRGFDRLETDVREAGRQGDESWPPSYAAFVGYCEPPVGYAAHKPFLKALPVSEQVRQERKAVGLTALEEILGGLKK